MKMTRLMIGVCVGALALVAGAAPGVKVAQQVTLQKGWNAVYVTVAPDESADEIFADWPTDRVGVYDPASFLATRQYSGAGSNEGVASSGFLMWYRSAGELSQFKRIAANSVYVCFATEAWSGTLYGRPAAPRITWHPSSTSDPMNYVGFSLANGAKVTLGQYFDGVDIGTAIHAFLVCGGEPDHYSLMSATGQTEFGNGDVVVLTAANASDWSGTLRVTPMSGLDFSSNVTHLALSVRNDGAASRTVALELGGGAAAKVGDIPPQLAEGFMLRDETVATNGWVAFATSRPFSKKLAAGETLELTLALDRSKMAGPAGTYYGSILTIRDVDGGSNMRVSLPVEATGDGGAMGEFAWPKGVWLAAGELDAVSFIQKTADGTDNAPVAAGGKMKVRLPLYVEADGSMRLLQRFTHGIDADGLTHVYSAATEGEFPVAIGDVKRVSSSVLPIDEPIIGVYVTSNSIDVVTTNGVEVTTNSVTEVTTNGAFGTTALFAFTVNESSKVNPFRHVYHPSHDGLKWDFKSPTPSGDNFQNYVSTVKPEIFSVANRVTLTWDESNGAAWSPDEKLSGDLVWELDGVRHEGTIRMTGRFTMRRITNVTIDK